MLKNLTLKEIKVGNLFNSKTELNLTILSDSDPKLRFSRLITD